MPECDYADENLMRILTLKSVHYRNLRSQSLQVHPRLNIALGQNGQGKSNFLEMIHVLVTGKSFRTQNLQELIPHEHANQEQGLSMAVLNYSLTGEEMPDGELNVRLMNARPQVFANGKRTTSSQLAQTCLCLSFTPTDLQIVQAEPQQRRDLLDQACGQMNSKFHKLRTEFFKSLRARNSFLSSVQMTSDSLHQAINQQYLALANSLARSRFAAIRKLEPHLQACLQSLFDPNVEIKIRYSLKSEDGIFVDNPEEIEDFHGEQMARLIDKERLLQRTLFGPQKHDVDFIWNGHSARRFCSQGQQRALILAFKMAQIQYHVENYGDNIIVVLDDVTSELDLERRQRLIDFLTQINAQIFLSTTDLSELEHTKASLRPHFVYDMRAGFIRQREE